MISRNAEQKSRAELVEVLQRMYHRGFIVAGDGNVSARVGDRHYLVTPSGVDKGYLREDDLILVDKQGQSVKAKQGLKPTSEMAMHLYIYEARPDVNAVVHAHPPSTIACSLAGISLARCLMPEVIFAVGSIVSAGYATPTTEAVPRAMAESLKRHDAIVLDRHGSVTLGDDPFQAYSRLETVEHTARITIAAQSAMGGKPVPAMNPGEVKRIYELAGRMGFESAQAEFGGCGDCNACPVGRAEPEASPPSSGNEEAVLEAITQAVLDRLS